MTAASNSTSTPPIRVGVVGLGFGIHHVRTLANLAGAQLVAVADRKSERTEACARQYGAAAYRDGVEMMAREELQAVCVCTSPAKRQDLLRAAADAGIALFVEKPWSSDVDHGQRLAAICAQNPAPVMTAFSFRYHPVVARLKGLMDDGEQGLGAGFVLNGHYAFDGRAPAGHWLWDPADGNGFFNENSCHLFDVVCHLMGRPVSVHAEAGTFMDCPSADGAALSLRFENGGVAALTVGAVATAAMRDFPRIEVMAAGGHAVLQGRGHIWEELTWACRGDAEAQRFAQPPEALGTTRYTHAMQHFLDCVRSGASPGATVDDGVRSVAVAMGVTESARRGARVDLTW